MVNLTNWTAVESLDRLLVEANANSPFWLAVLGMIFAVLLITFSKLGIVIALLSSLFLSFVVGIFLAYLGLVEWLWVLMILGILIVMIFYVIFINKDD